MSDNCQTKERPGNAKEFLSSSFFWKPFAGIVIGGVAGFLYYYFIGCSSGSCPITGSPYLMTIWGSLFGFFIVSRPCGRCF